MNTNTDPVRTELLAIAREMKMRSLDGATRSALLYSDDLRVYADRLRAIASAPPSAPVGVAEAWQEGYRQGVLDERTSEDNIGIAGFGAKVEPARNNPYALAQQPASDKFIATFRCEGNGIVGTTPAKIHAVTQHDDGCIEVVIDHWPQQPAAPSGEAVAWLRMKPDGTPDWAEDCIGSDDQFLDHEMASDGYYLQPLYAAPQQPAGVDEAPTWSRQQPTVPGIYGIRGFNLCRPASEQFEAVVVVREHGGELVCNLHESTSEDDLESWAPICDLDPDFEWRVFVPGWQQQGGRADG